MGFGEKAFWFWAGTRALKCIAQPVKAKLAPVVATNSKIGAGELIFRIAAYGLIAFVGIWLIHVLSF
jgi:hypothetical protein